MPPKVLIGTMHCGEGDFARCRASVAAQTFACEHYVIENQPEAEAHAALYRRFKESDAHCLIKLDADMVFKAPGDVALIVSRLRETGAMKVSHMVDDFFTGRPILGVHCYSQAVEFDWAAFTRGDLYADRRNSVHALPAAERPRVWKIFNEPIAWHCHWSTDLQAFHYGYHRWLKSQFDVCRQVLDHLAAAPGDSRLQMACLGMIAAAERPTRAAASYGRVLTDLYQASRCARPISAIAPELDRLLQTRGHPAAACA